MAFDLGAVQLSHGFLFKKPGGAKDRGEGVTGADRTAKKTAKRPTKKTVEEKQKYKNE